jgi:hypothetical protein
MHFFPYQKTMSMFGKGDYMPQSLLTSMINTLNSVWRIHPGFVTGLTQRNDTTQIRRTTLHRRA